MKTKHLVLTLFLAMSVVVSVGNAQVVADKDQNDRGSAQPVVRDALRDAARQAALEEREPIIEAHARLARHVGTSDGRRAATAIAIRTCGARFVRRFVGSFSPRRLKSESRSETHAARREIRDRTSGARRSAKRATAMRIGIK